MKNTKKKTKVKHEIDFKGNAKIEGTLLIKRNNIHVR